MGKNNKVLLAKIFAILLIFFSIGSKVIADSGFDFDYDSGSSSSSSSSSWSSSSSSSYDSDYSYSGGGSSDPVGTLIVFIIIVIIIIIASRSGGKGGNSTGITNSSVDKDEVTLEEIQKFIPDFDRTKFQEQAFNIYKGIQEAWTNFDTDTIRKLTTDEMFNMYSMQLDTLKAKKQQNIMKDITMNNFAIKSIKEEDGIINITTTMSISMYDYIVKKDTSEVLRGSDKTKAFINYRLTFVRDKNSGETIEKCPSCGAQVDMNASGKCPYCDSTIVVNAKDFVLSKKENLRQG